MKVLHLSLALAILSLLAPSLVYAQASAGCTGISVDGPTSDSTEGASLVLTARLNGIYAKGQHGFRWQVSAGTIVSGEDKESVTIDTTGLAGVVLTATVSVSGLTATCPSEASTSINITGGIICGLRFDEYGDIPFEDEKARLDNFAIQISHEKDMKGYIFAYAGRRSYEGEKAERLLRAKQYLVRTRGISAERIVTVDGGYREELETTLIIVPEGATIPEPMPTLRPDEIELTKPRPKVVRKNKQTSQ